MTFFSYVATFPLSFSLSPHQYDSEFNCWLLRIASVSPTVDVAYAVSYYSSLLLLLFLLPCDPLSLDPPFSLATYIIRHQLPSLSVDFCVWLLVLLIVWYWNHDGKMHRGGDTPYLLQYRSTPPAQMKWISPRHPTTRLVYFRIACPRRWCWISVNWGCPGAWRRRVSGIGIRRRIIVG